MQEIERAMLKSGLSTSLHDLDETDVDTLFAQIRYIKHQTKVEQDSYMIINGKRYRKTTIDKMASYRR